MSGLNKAKKLYQIGTVLVFGMFLVSCTKVKFEAMKTSQLINALASPTIVIDDGAMYSNASDRLVKVTISADIMKSYYLTNDPSCNSGGKWIRHDFESYHNLDNSWYLSQNSSNSTAKVYAKFRDSEGLESNCVSDSIIHDDQPPVVSLLEQPKKWTNKNQSKLVASAEDATSGIEKVECAYNQTDNFFDCTMQISSAKSLSLSHDKEGTQSFYIRAFDKAGNASATLPYDWNLDQTKPTVEVTERPKEFSNSKFSDFKFKGNDPYGAGIAKIECALDSTNLPTDCSNGSISYTPMDGDHTFYVRATDRADNVGDWVNVDWVIDTIAPTVELVEYPLNPINKKDANFKFEYSDGNGSGVVGSKCSVDSLSYADCDALNMQSYADLNDGNRKFSVFVVDKAGNESNPAKYDWMIDTKGPTVTITKMPDPLTNMKTASFEFRTEDSGVGVDKTKCAIDQNVNYMDCNSPYTYQNLIDGEHIFYVRGYDKLGNVGDPASYTWNVDTKGPTKPIVKGVTGGQDDKVDKWLGTTLVPTVHFQTVVDAIKYGISIWNSTGDSVVCAPQETNNSPHTLSGCQLEDSKDYILKLVSTDSLNNTTAADDFELSVDVTPPIISISGIDSPMIVPDHTVATSIQDSGSGFGSGRCGYDGILNSCGQTGSYSASLMDGNHSFKVEAFDIAGNYAEKTEKWEVYFNSLVCTEEVHKQPTNVITDKLDILFVMDTSSSLDGERSKIANGIGGFVSKLNSTSDFKVAVMLAHGTETNGNPGTHMGKLYRRGTEPLVLSSSMGLDTVKTHLLNKIGNSLPGQNSTDGGEAGLVSLNYSLTTNYSLIQSQGFFRNDAALAIVFVSDEQDICARTTSDGSTVIADPNGKEIPAYERDCVPNNITPSNMVNLVRNKKIYNGKQMPVILSGLIYTGPTVPTGGENEIGWGYKETVEQSNGILVDLYGNGTSFSEKLAKIGEATDIKLNLLTEFKLNFSPVVEKTIKVEVAMSSVEHTFIKELNQVNIKEPGNPGDYVNIDYCYVDNKSTVAGVE